MYWGHESNFFIFNFLHSPILPILLAWEVVWKSIALWKSARHNQLYWFIAIAILNTAGILPIIYILGFQKDRKTKKQGK